MIVEAAEGFGGGVGGGVGMLAGAAKCFGEGVGGGVAKVAAEGLGGGVANVSAEGFGCRCLLGLLFDGLLEPLATRGVEGCVVQLEECLKGRQITCVCYARIATAK